MPETRPTWSQPSRWMQAVGGDPRSVRRFNKEAATAAYQIAELYAARQVSDAAFEWLERAYVQRDGGLTALKTNARFRSLHDDPRWGAFLKKMGLED